MSVSPRSPAFPTTEEFARSFFGEAIRHLADARVLHTSGRHAASITSSMKTAETGVKAALILENVMGLYDRVFATHKPLTIIEGNRILKRLNSALEMQRAGLSADVKAMESLEPTAFGKGEYDPAKGAANTEYPFLEGRVDASANLSTVILSPQAYFSQADSLRYYLLSRELLTALPQLNPVMKGWGLPLPESL
jgi:hypothetical protein